MPSKSLVPRVPTLPAPVPTTYRPFEITTPGNWLVFSDHHIPFHDSATIELAVKQAKKEGVRGILLNGDLLDSHEISRHDKDPSAPRYKQEIEICKEFLKWLRYQFPKARIVYKLGNHEERLDTYVIRNAPALWGLEGLNLFSLLNLDKFGVELVEDRRVITIDKINIIHGHEFNGGCSSPVNPARGLYMKARAIAMAGHHHQSSEFHTTNIAGKLESAWSLGCCCDLHPTWLRLNTWNHGFAIIRRDNNGFFSVDNARVTKGHVV